MSEELKQAVTPDNTVNKSGSPQAELKGFYYSALTDEEKLEYHQVIETEGLLDEIYLMRIKTKFLAKREPNNLTMLMRLINCLERLVRTQFRLFKSTKGRIPGIRRFIESFKLPPDVMSQKLSVRLRSPPGVKVFGESLSYIRGHPGNVCKNVVILIQNRNH